MGELSNWLPTLLSLSSVGLSLYLWLVKMNHERPRFKVMATSPVDQTPCMSGWRTDRTELLGAFSRDRVDRLTSPAGVGCYCFLFRAMVVNQSTIPHAVASVRVWVKMADGTWTAINTAFVNADAGIGGPFNLNWENGPGRTPIEPRSFVVAPDKGHELKVLAWFDVPLGADRYTWRRVKNDDVEAAVASFGRAAVAQPLAMRVEVRNIQGQSFSADIDPTGSAVPASATVTGLRTPPIPAYDEALKPKQVEDAIESMRGVLRENADPATGLIVLEGEKADDFDTEFEAVVYGLLAQLALGEKVDAAAARAWLQSRQDRDGSFRQAGGKLDPTSPAARMANTYAGVLGLHALNAKPAHDPLPAYTAALAEYCRAQTAEGKAVCASRAVDAVHICRLVGVPVPAEIEQLVGDAFAANNPNAGYDTYIESPVVAPVRLAELRGQSVPEPAGKLDRVLAADVHAWYNDAAQNTPDFLARVYRAVKLLGAPAPVLARLGDEITKRAAGWAEPRLYNMKSFYFIAALFGMTGRFNLATKPSDPVCHGIGEHAS